MKAPGHGTLAIHQGGKTRYVDLCQCHKTGLAEVVVKDAGNAQELIARRITDAENKSVQVADALKESHAGIAEQVEGVRNQVNSLAAAVERNEGHHDQAFANLSGQIETVRVPLEKLISACDAVARANAAEQSDTKALTQVVLSDLMCEGQKTREEVRESVKELQDDAEMRQAVIVREFASIRARLCAAESVTLWTLIKRCFGR